MLTIGDRTIMFVLSNYSAGDGNIFQNKESKINKEVYVFSWSTPSIFAYQELRRRVTICFKGLRNKGTFTPQMELPQTLCDELLATHRLLLDGNLEKAESSFSFFYWIIDKGHGVFNFCINTYFDALLFLPLKIIVKETGKTLRW